MVDNAVIILVPSFLIMVHISNVMARVSIQCPTSMNHKSLKLIWFVINQNMERSLNIFSVFFKVRSLFNESHQLEQDYFVLRNDINCLFNFTKNNEFKENEYFTEICLPGMTEEFRLPVFFKHFLQNEQKTDLKIVFACEDQTEKI